MRKNSITISHHSIKNEKQRSSVESSSPKKNQFSQEKPYVRTTNYWGKIWIKSLILSTPNLARFSTISFPNLRVCQIYQLVTLLLNVMIWKIKCHSLRFVDLNNNVTRVTLNDKAYKLIVKSDSENAITWIKEALTKPWHLWCYLTYYVALVLFVKTHWCYGPIFDHSWLCQAFKYSKWN